MPTDLEKLSINKAHVNLRARIEAAIDDVAAAVSADWSGDAGSVSVKFDIHDRGNGNVTITPHISRNLPKEHFAPKGGFVEDGAFQTEDPRQRTFEQLADEAAQLEAEHKAELKKAAKAKKPAKVEQDEDEDAPPKKTSRGKRADAKPRKPRSPRAGGMSAPPLEAPVH